MEKDTSFESSSCFSFASTTPTNESDDNGSACAELPSAPTPNNNVEMCDHRETAMEQEPMDIDEEMGAVGGTRSDNPEHSNDEKNVDLSEPAGAQNGVDAKCCNPDCFHTSREFFLAPLFVLNSYEIRKRKKTMFICDICFYAAVDQFETLGDRFINQEPLYSVDLPPASELVEVLDSSDEETESTVNETVLSPDVALLVENEMQSIMESAFQKYNFNQQIEEYVSMHQDNLTRIEEECVELDTTIRTLRKGLDTMQHVLYSCVKGTVQHLPAISIIDDSWKLMAVERCPVQVNEIYFGMPGSLMGGWSQCKVLEEIQDGKNPLKYVVLFLLIDAFRIILVGKHIAYSTPPSVRLQQGMRIIAKADPAVLAQANGGQQPSDNSFYAGVIAETLSTYNNHRYLVIFDNGDAHYAFPWNVRVVCEQSTFVWEDVDPHTREYVRDYLNNYKSVRPMVQVKKGQRMMTEKDGSWRQSVVANVDSSLVLLYFPELRQSEWIFRGSKRLGPLYYDRKRGPQQISKFQKRNIPSIEYITIDDDDDDGNTAIVEGARADRAKSSERDVSPTASTSDNISYPSDSKASLAYLKQLDSPRPSSSKTSATEPWSTATAPQPPQIVMNKSIIYCDNDRPQGKTSVLTISKFRGPAKYIPHECSPECMLQDRYDLDSYHLLARPLASGWERQICKARGKKSSAVVYLGPCGRRLRYMYELHRYLRITQSPLNVENFDFDPDIRALAIFTCDKMFFEMKDLSCGKEQMAVSCVNFFDDTCPPPCEYSTKRIPTEGVNLNLDDEFLCGCDCEDDCFDKSRCQCWQLTIQGETHSKRVTSIDDVGYVYKRLDELVMTGIYECNSRCKCKVNECLNRVVQHPLQTKLQVFKTSNRGWGIRCLNDVPKGSFICIYTGHLLTEETSNLICAQNADKTGDEYFADLDYIETAEQVKEDYESEAVEPWSKEYESNDETSKETDDAAVGTMQDSDDEFTSKSRPSGRVVNTRAKLKESKSKNANQPSNISKPGPGQDRERVNLIPKSFIDTGSTLGLSDYRIPFRQLIGPNESPYVMDAKKTGNLGRYFNHSCEPNLFVQNVFVDTHDLRFPWVAFFSIHNIEAGSELTWNYNYDVGSVPGKVLYCHCSAPRCRRRLL